MAFDFDKFEVGQVWITTTGKNWLVVEITETGQAVLRELCGKRRQFQNKPPRLWRRKF